ncbi:hypothetical protein GQ53DRAFT_46947 [Thozetella sp. PMI_491]|nr:hypothetical protein GQ53DRAFT_93497 [Thozetella sp. PMI_491]KAH8879099.1 hypothetical protein GQ53DRAFT_46947 [Thozetella sp. PMI_491]
MLCDRPKWPRRGACMPACLARQEAETWPLGLSPFFFSRHLGSILCADRPVVPPLGWHSASHDFAVRVLWTITYMKALVPPPPLLPRVVPQRETTCPRGGHWRRWPVET